MTRLIRFIAKHEEVVAHAAVVLVAAFALSYLHSRGVLQRLFH